MRIPHTLLMVLAAAVLWGFSRYAAPYPPKEVEEVPAIAIPGSAFGSLIARTMRESLYSYWHGGEAYRAMATKAAKQEAASSAPAPPPTTPGVFKRRTGASDAPAAASPAAAAPVLPEPDLELSGTGTPVDKVAGLLNKLESQRTRKSGPVVLSPAHRRYIEASAGWRLRLAYNLDPGDPALYEILYHYITTTSSQDLVQIKERSRIVTEKALAQAKSSQGGMASALTGVGAAINNLNDLILAAQPGFPSKSEIDPHWENILSCQQQFRETRAAAEQEGWWLNIPLARRVELDSHARFLDGLVVKFRNNLVARGYVVSHQ